MSNTKLPALPSRDELELFAQHLCRTDKLIWAGFRPDADGFHTIPVISNSTAKLVEEFAQYYARQALADRERQAGEAVAYTPGEWFDATTVDLMEAFFRSRLPAIREAAKEHGYAIGVHGSLRRDLDLIAAPWRDGASDADTLADAIQNAACGIHIAKHQWEQKPAGRVATSMPICWTHRQGVLSDGHIDLSVLASLPAPQAVQAEPLSVGFSPMHLAPIDGTAVLLHLPTTIDGFAIGHWHGDFWGDDEGSRYIHEPTGWMGLHVLQKVAAAPSPDGKAEQAEAPSDTARLVMAAGIANQYGVLEDCAFACAERILSLATQPTASNAGERGAFEGGEQGEKSDGELWSFLRSVMAQGADIHQDYLGGKHATYERYSARLDAAASNRVHLLRAALASKPPAGEQKPVGPRCQKCLGSEFPGWKRGWRCVACNGTGLAPEDDAQPEQVAQDKTDAERYRWLREADPDEGPFIAEVLTNDWGNSYPCAVHQEAADKRIDAARARGEGKQ